MCFLIIDLFISHARTTLRNDCVDYARCRGSFVFGTFLFTRGTCINTTEIYVGQIGIFIAVGTVTISPGRIDFGKHNTLHP